MIPELAGALALAIWVYILIARRPEWNPPSAGPPDSSPPIAAVIPARNEELTIGAAVASLDRQTYAGSLQIFVVDDDSDDGTAACASAAAPPARLTVLRAASLQPGWTGKLWALAEGVQGARTCEPEYFLFTDADIVHPPENLDSLVARAQHGGYALVSYMATLRCATPAERALIPAFVYFFFLLYPPRWVRNPRRKLAGAAGGCILLRRDALEKIGGLAAIRRELIDDCALARAVQRHGGRVWLGVSRETRSIRDYRTFGEIGRMISRTAFTQLRYSAVVLAGTVLAMTIVFAVPPVLTLAAAQPARGIGALAWLLMSVSYAPALRYYRRSPLWAPLLPLLAAFYLGCTLHSAFSYWRGVGGLWKGRHWSS